MGVIGESSVVLVPAVQKSFGAVAPKKSDKEFSALKGFGFSPPERIGVLGEYDYNGLAKRVEHCFKHSVSDDTSQLKVRQRGCVVILTGRVSSRSLLNRLVNLATRIEGTALVEIYSITFAEEEVLASEEFVA